MVGKHQVGSVAFHEIRTFAPLPSPQSQLCENLPLAQIQNQKMGLDYYDQTMRMTAKPTGLPFSLTCQSPGCLLGICQDVQLFSIYKLRIKEEEELYLTPDDKRHVVFMSHSVLQLACAVGRITALPTYLDPNPWDLEPCLITCKNEGYRGVSINCP